MLLHSTKVHDFVYILDTTLWKTNDMNLERKRCIKTRVMNEKRINFVKACPLSIWLRVEILENWKGMACMVTSSQSCNSIRPLIFLVSLRKSKAHLVSVFVGICTCASKSGEMVHLPGIGCQSASFIAAELPLPSTLTSGQLYTDTIWPAAIS